MEHEFVDIQDLPLRSIIGFDGNAVKGLKVHPNGQHIIYPFGTKVAVVHLGTKDHRYLMGHTNVITSIAVSKSGKFVAAGQVNHMGFKAPVFVWEFETGQVKFTHESHKVRVENVAFSSCERYIISLGGKDDANVVVFDIETHDAVCGTFSSNKNAGDAVTLGPLNTRNLCFISGGVYTLKVWTLNPSNRSVSGIDVQMGKIRRKVTCIEVTEDDDLAWCGTSTGDVMKVVLNFSKTDKSNFFPVAPPALVGCFAKYPKKMKKEADSDLWVTGVRSIIIMPDNKLIVGAGDGSVDLVKMKQYAPKYKTEKGSTLAIPTYPLFVPEKSCYVGNFVTSMQIMMDNYTLLVGTIRCEIMMIDLSTFQVHLYLTCHTTTVYDMAFPSDYSAVFATASKNDVRVWSVSKSRELLRISVPNFSCSAVIFSHDGRSIVTGWNDGTVRAFTPQTGRHIYTINDAHNKGVSALDMTSDGKKLMTGGIEGQVRIWCIRKDVQKLLAVLKEHKGPVSSLQISPNDNEAASASTDGSCILWDLVKCVRLAIMFSTTLFLCVRFHPNACQLLTTGTNRQIGYWETFDGALIREIEGSRSSALNCLDISKDGMLVASGGNDQYVKLWKYKEGIPTHIGLGHGAVITSVRISPDGKTIVSASADGAIFIWGSPYEKSEETDKEEILKVTEYESEPVKSAVSSREKSKRGSTSGSIEEQDVKKELAKACKDMKDAKDKLQKIREKEEEAELEIEEARRKMNEASLKLIASPDGDDKLEGSRRSSRSSASSRHLGQGDGAVKPTSKTLGEYGSVKCYCEGKCTCENNVVPPSPKTPLEKAREELISDVRRENSS